MPSSQHHALSSTLVSLLHPPLPTVSLGVHLPLPLVPHPAFPFPFPLEASRLPCSYALRNCARNSASVTPIACSHPCCLLCMALSHATRWILSYSSCTVRACRSSPLWLSSPPFPLCSSCREPGVRGLGVVQNCGSPIRPSLFPFLPRGGGWFSPILGGVLQPFGLGKMAFSLPGLGMAGQGSWSLQDHIFTCWHWLGLAAQGS